MYINREGLQFSRMDKLDYSTMSNIFITWLKGFKELHKTHPFKGCPSSYLPPYNGEHPSDEVIEGACEAFYRDIDKLLYALEDELPDMPSEEEGEDVLNRPADEGWLEECREHEKRVEEGLALFPKLYQHLWI